MTTGTKITLAGGVAYQHFQSFKTVLQMIEEKISDWQDRYDERYCNEPEYPSQQERWQDALDRLEARIDELKDIQRHYEDWYEGFTQQYSEDTPKDGIHRPYVIDYDGFVNILNEVMELNSYRPKGLTDIVKYMREISKELRWDIHVTELKAKLNAEQTSND